MIKILLIAGTLNTGGIETLIVRVATAWHSNGVKVSVLLFSNDGDEYLLDQLKKVAKVYYLKDIVKFHSLYFKSLTAINYFLPLSKANVKNLLEDVDHLHFIGSFSMMFCLRLSHLHSTPLKISGGVYHQHEFSYGKLPNKYYLECFKKVFGAIIPASNIIFFNEASIRNLSENSGLDFSASPLLPIGIDISMYGMRNLNNINRTKIVSIGRIVNFKTYNFQFIRSLELLKEKSLNFTYHIYGDGSLMTALQDEVNHSKVADQVYLHGKLDYSKFKDAVSDAFLFIGSGTALIEAAACGVPALIGIESEESDQSYGFLHSMAGYSYQEKGIPVATSSFSSFCEKLYFLDQVEYAEECQRSQHKAQEFSIEKMVAGFDLMHENAAPIESGVKRFIALFFLMSLVWNYLLERKNNSSFFRRYNFG
jgi:glycosyltransferase involved in cell wall biosynthesis